MMKKVLVKKARKSFVIICFLAILCISITGCHGPQYTEEEAKEVVDKGTSLMEAWISKNCPGGKLVEIDHWDKEIPGGPSYLTDFVCGTINDGIRDRDFQANIVTGFVALKPDDEMLNSFNDCCKELYLESLGLDKDAEAEIDEVFDTYLTYSPLCEKSQDKLAGWSFLFSGLPGELVLQNGNIADYVNDPNRGTTIQINGWMRHLPDDFVIEKYTYEDILEQQKKYDIQYHHLVMENSNESLSASLNDYEYEKWQYEDFDGRTVYSRCVFRQAEIDENGAIINKKEYTPSPKDSVKIQKKDDRYIFEMDESEELYFILYVPEGDELLKHNYLEKDPSGKMSDEELFWQETEHGWTLVDDMGNNCMFYRTTELVITD